MNFPISNDAKNRLMEFSRREKILLYIYEDQRIEIKRGLFSIIFLNIERYDNLIYCQFDFGGGVIYFINEVASAVATITGEKIPEMCEFSKKFSHSFNRDEEIIINDKYIDSVIIFLFRFGDFIFSNPPIWFKRAARLTDRKIRNNFPDLADDALGAKLRLLESWK